MKVGVFDSGLGGLTVVQAISKLLKGAEIFYIADTAHAPYGEKTKKQILRYSLSITQYLIEHYQIDALIVACNTATSAAIQNIREVYPDLIVIGTEPGIKPAIGATRTNHIGVLATPATLKGEKYQQLVSELSSGSKITLHEQACPGLVEQIERGETSAIQTREMLQDWLSPMVRHRVDTIVLGCTHYPLVSDLIKEIIPYDVVLVETGEAIARHLLAQAQSRGHQNKGALKLHLYTTAKIHTEIIDEILPGHEPVEQIEIS